MESALAIANTLIEIAHSKGRTISPMQLLKQVYYAHGWHLALKKEPLIDESVEAWQFGPVVPSIYHAFKHFKGDDITGPESTLDLEKFEFVTPTLNPDSKAKLLPFLEKISDTYGKMTGAQLSSLTHQPNSPWYEVWNSRGGKNRKGTDIPDQLIQKHFSDRIEKAA